MVRVLVVLHLAMLVVASLYEDEHLVPRIEHLLGGITQLSPAALQSEQALRRVELALQQLSIQNGGLSTHRLINILSGTRQVVNGFIFVFIVEVESLPTQDSMHSNGIIEVYEIEIYEPAARNAEKRYTFRKISHYEN